MSADRPTRIQRKRTKGWRTPPNTVYVGRPTRWGNPFILCADRGRFGVWQDGTLQVWPATTIADAQKSAVSLFRLHMQDRMRSDPGTANLLRKHLGRKNLCCWCRLDEPCHADVLLELANMPLTCEAADV